MKRLPDTELEVMKALWLSGPDTSRTALEQKLVQFNWAPNTINTYLTRLVEKEFISVRKEGRGNLYTPLISQEEYLEFDSHSVLSRLYGTPRNFVAALARQGITQKDVDDLRALLNELDGGSRRD